MRRSLFLFAFLLFFSACDIDTKSDLSFDLGSFEHRSLSRDDAELLISDSLLLGEPTGIRLHPDGFLVIKDNKVRHQVTIVDLRDGSTQGFVTRGRGPMEVITAWDIGIDGDDIWVSGPQESKMIRIALDREAIKFNAVEELDLSTTRFMNALPVTESRFLTICNPRSESRMEIVNKAGESIRKVGSFPDVVVQSDFAINNAWLESVFTISPDNEHTAVSCRTIDYIDIYDSNMGLIKRLRGPIGAEPDFFVRTLPVGTQFLQKPRYYVYESTASNDKMFFVSYNGIEVKSEADLREEAHRIFSFDWSGRPLKCYTFDHPVRCFDVDVSGEKLYIVTRDDESLEPEILIYNL